MNRMQVAAALAALMLAAGVQISGAQVVRYVDFAATGVNDGTSWTDAFTSLQSALGVAGALDQVWVAQGTYIPGATRADAFLIPDKVLMYGGFTNGMATIAERNPALYPSILSGDVNGDDTANFGNRGDNTYHVVRLPSDLRRDIRLDGFVIRGGNADIHLGLEIDGSTPQDSGGGMTANTADRLTIANCTFVDNSAEGAGALWIRRGLDMKIEDCVFAGNRATLSDSDYGSGAIGGPANSQNAGYICNVLRSTFVGNTAQGRGGAIYDTPGSWNLNLIDCLVAGNLGNATWGGGGLYLRAGTNAIVNTTIAFNSPDGVQVQLFTNIVVNSIIWSNENTSLDVVPFQSGSLLATYSDIGRVYTNAGDIQADPKWVGGTSSTWTAAGTYLPGAGKTRLTRSSATWAANAFAGLAVNPDTTQKRQFLVSSNTATEMYVWGDASTIAGNGDTFKLWSYQLGAGSPCIDTGTNLVYVTNDIAQVTRPKNGTMDMGAYESSATGSVAGVIYVNDNATGGNDGSTWQHAYTNLQTALGIAVQGNQIWVAGGTYKPGVTRVSSFVLPNRVPVYGGFAGSETTAAQRDIRANPTILSGDLSNNDTTNFGSRADNAYHVVSDINFTKDVRLDGFIIQGGNADAGTAFDEAAQGGGLFSVASSNLVVANCVFQDNTAVAGGAAYIKQPRPNWITFLDTVFSGNRATEVGNERGGGAVSGHAGLGIPGYLLFDRCVFTGNRAAGSIGGALGTDDTLPLEARVVNCLVAGNLSGYNDGGGAQGGGLFLRTGPANLLNSTLAYNQPYGFTSKDTVVTGQNVIVWNNITSEILLLNNSFAARASDVDEAGYDGLNGNIRQDPQWLPNVNGVATTAAFAPATGLSTLTAVAAWVAGEHTGKTVNPDLTQNQHFLVKTNTATTLTIFGDITAVGAGAADSFRIHDFHLTNSSPCVDSGLNIGAPALDLDGAARPAGFATDMGAYEFGGSPLFPGGVAYVDRDATGANNGLSWADAYTNLQSVLAIVPGGREVWVAEGTYRPGSSTNSTFTLRANVAIYGGFAGNESNRTDRAPASRLTILSGDLLGNDGNDNLITALNGARADNARHVVTGVDSATLDGFVIMGGYAANADEGNADAYGGGLLANGTSPTITDCRFVDNYATAGGAVGVLGSGAPVFERCAFSGNFAGNGGSVYSFGTPVFARCMFAGNTATNTFVGAGSGAALYFLGATQPVLENCLLVGNSSDIDGAIRVEGNNGSNTVRLVNCTLARNTGMGVGALYIKRACQPQVWNSILWGNNALDPAVSDEIGIDSINPGSVVVRYSDVTGGFTGTGNVNTNPLFLAQFTGTWSAVNAFNPATRQTTLTHAGASWLPNQLQGFVVHPNTNQLRHFVVASNTSTSLVVWGNAQLVTTAGNSYRAQDYDLAGNSPCVDIATSAGAPNRDFDGRPRPRGAGIDMGAYEFQSLSSLGMHLIIR